MRRTSVFIMLWKAVEISFNVQLSNVAEREELAIIGDDNPAGLNNREKRN